MKLSQHIRQFDSLPGTLVLVEKKAVRSSQ